MLGSNLYWACCTYVVGCYCGLTNYTWMYWRWLFLAWALVALAGMVLAKKMVRVFFVALGLCFFSLGLWSGCGADYPGKRVAPLFYQQVTVEGSIDPLSVRHYTGGSSCILRGRSITLGQKTIETSWKFRVAANVALPQSGQLAVSGQLLPLNTMRNEGTFDMETWNRVQGLAGRLRQVEVRLLPEGGSGIEKILDQFALWNLSIRQGIMQVLPGDRGALFCGMVLGGQQGLSEETQEVFRANGLSHLLAVSGTHVLLLTGLLLLLLRSVPARYRLSILLLMLVAYACLCGLKPAVLRALLMALPLIFSIEKVQRDNLFLLTAMLLLFVKPLWLLDLGFQMSFAAAGGILWLQKKLRGYAYLYLPDFLAEVLTITGAAQLGVLPFLIAYFHQFSLLSFLSSLILIPVLELGVVLGLAGYLLLVIFDWNLLLQGAGTVIAQALHWADLLSGIPGTMLTVATLPLWCAGLYYLWWIFLLFLPVVHGISLTTRRLVLWSCFVILGGTLGWCQWGPVPFRAYFLDVGQGDCAVLITPRRQAVVIDVGGARGLDTGSRILAPFLRSQGVSRVALLLLSHGDMDHAAGGAGLVRNLPVEKIILQPHNLSEYQENLVRLAEPDGVVRAAPGMSYTIDGVEVKILDLPERSEKNTDSILAAVHWQGYGLLFTGDIDSNRERALSWEGRYHLVKVPHHGSRYSNSEEFYEALKPEVAVLSVGRDNGYGHPHREALEHIQESGAQLFRTDRDGMITVEFNDDGYSVKTM